MRDEEVRGLLRRLPRAHASPAFTESVLARLDRGAPPRSRFRQPALVASATAGTLLVLVGVLVLVAPDRAGGRPEVAASPERIQRLQSEYRTLERQLEELRLLSAESQPFVGVRGDDGVDYLVDLRDLLASGPAQAASYPSDRSRRSDG